MLTERLEIKITKEMRGRLNKAAEECGINISSFIRMSLMQSLAKTSPAKKRIPFPILEDEHER